MQTKTKVSPRSSESSLLKRKALELGADKFACWLKANFSEDELISIPYNWLLNGRPKQLIPVTTDWDQILYLAGRGSGKTTTGSQTTRYFADTRRATRIAIIGKTVADVRNVMINSKGGILNVCPPWNRPKYEPSKRLLTWPNGVIAHTYSGDEPDQLRGPEHDFVWADEIAKWKYAEETLSNIRLGLRLGESKALYTGTPLPLKVIRELIKDPATTLIKGTMHENADNLTPQFIAAVERRYKGTRLYKQEVLGELLEDNPQAVWKRAWIDANIVYECPTLLYIVVAVDPNVSNTERSDEMGIVVVGVASNGHHYILGDYSMRGSPLERGIAIRNAWAKHNADYIVYEANQGGDLVAHMIAIAAPNARIESVYASRGKRPRAEPIGMLHEQGKSHFVQKVVDGDEGDPFDLLKDQMCEWMPADKTSPDRMDALVWAETWLTLKYGEPGGGVIDITEEFGGIEHDVGRIGLGF